MSKTSKRHVFMGATTTPSGVFFRVWAPDHQQVEVEFEDGTRPILTLASEEDGFFSAACRWAVTGDLYRYRLDGGESHPDPYSRYQPKGPHGPSMIVDPTTYQWHDASWQGLDPAQQIVYELHIGTFTEAGTYAAASQHLARLLDLGITCIEIMPVNQFAGRFGWGYDGVNWFAPFHPYGEPDALRAFVDHSHELGLGVILDAVYNHFGHDGNYLPRFGAEYVTDKIKNPWGSAPNYECHAMRHLAMDNAAYWIREFHFDGLRLDAIQNIHDPESPSLLSDLVSGARKAAGTRTIMIAAEDYLQRTPLIETDRDEGADIDHLWNDDFHHACRAALTGNHYGFFKNYRGTAQEILSSLKHGFLYQGQYDASSHMNRGVATRDQPLYSFVAFTQNHDAVANTLHGQRIHSIVSPGKYRALLAVLLLGPQTPLLFMGQEFAASTPFAYFADYPEEAGALWNGRRKEAEQFLPYRDPTALARILNPCAIVAVRASTLIDAEREANPMTTQLYKDLIALRKRFSALLTSGDVDGATLNEHAFVFRWFDDEIGDRLLLVNLGPQIDVRAWAEPLLAPPRNRQWTQLWSSESAAYGGMGAIAAETPEGWQLSSDSACLLWGRDCRDSAFMKPRL